MRRAALLPLLLAALFALAPAWATLLALAALPASARAEPEAMHAPHPGSSRRPPLATSAAPDYLDIVRRPAAAATAGPFTALLEVYRRVISPVDGDRCDMAPTCSLYAQQAFKEHGGVMGFLLTADRLLHEADERPLVRTEKVGRETFYVDPLWANTYWLPDWLK